MKFKTYSEERLDDQIALINDVIKDWSWKCWYPQKEKLKEIYSREGFTPETRHYVYDNDLLVGFLSSAVEEKAEGIQYGSIHILFIRKGYEHIEKEIMKKTFAVLKSKGVQVIRTSSMPGWGNYSQILKKRGFKQGVLLAQRTIFQPKKVLSGDYSKPEHIIEVKIEEDRKQLVEAIYLLKQQSKEEINSYLDRLLATNDYLASAIVMKDNKPLSCGLLYRSSIPKRAFIFGIPIAEDSPRHLVEDILLTLVQRAHRLEIELIWHQMHDISYTPYYSDLNLKFEPFHQFLLTL